MIKNHLRYLRTVLKHKWYVFLAGRKLHVPLWRLVIHDASKFSWSEWGPYVRRFEGGRAGNTDHEKDPEEWQRAWVHHWHCNTHHWEYWVRFKQDGSHVALLMPTVSVREMVADWTGAGRAYTGINDPREWYGKNRENMILHEKSRALVEELMGFNILSESE